VRVRHEQSSSLELPADLEQRIERVAKERNEEPATFLACAIDSLLNVEAAQLAEVRRRDLEDTGQCYTNEDAFAKLDSFALAGRYWPSGSEDGCHDSHNIVPPRDVSSSGGSVRISSSVIFWPGSYSRVPSKAFTRSPLSVVVPPIRLTTAS
jgi:predicted transcriptional regulator